MKAMTTTAAVERLTAAIPADLVERARRGDKEAMADLYRLINARIDELVPAMGGIKARQSRRDVVQNFFLRLLSPKKPKRKSKLLAATVTAGQAGDAVVAAGSKFVRGALFNEYVMVYRWERRQKRSVVRDRAGSEPLARLAGPAARPSRAALEKEVWKRVDEAAGGLSAADRELLRLLRTTSKSVPELAAAVGTSPENLTRRMSRLRTRLLALAGLSGE